MTSLAPPPLSITHLPSQTDTPTDLTANLQHHRDLFTKLRFSYTESVTKERLLKAASSDPPLFVAGGELLALETKLVGDKARLKGKKRDIATMLCGLEERSRGVAERWLGQEGRRRGVRGVEGEVKRLLGRKEELLALRPEEEGDVEMRMGLKETREVVREREAEGEEVARRVQECRVELERRRGDVERLKREMEGVEERKRVLVREVGEMRRRRGSGEVVMDEVEAKGRWNRAAEGVLRAVC
ncbi:hypothetical protein BDZ85DRAFT_298270 [Elsinoe ampelina]|uniref:Kinetochore protein Sos7 coiled-coil domain-containing protein n=1 Tax=Elsinoe ampelina TaxID=302913 RepID=A0A6A6G3A3_9PEZI|nr:hypothetical protein BDZ85DRAFT_298270 [Elsinoe ampelina]